MKISKIMINNIRGIENEEFSLNIPLNNPIIVVAPNGYGKTSIATAFSSLKSKKLDVLEDDLYRNNISNKPKLTISDDSGNLYTADENQNTISPNFDVFTIRGQVKSKASNHSFNGFSRATSALVVEPITLYKNIPSKIKFEYSFSSMKTLFGKSASKLITNYSALLKEPKHVFFITKNKKELLGLLQTRKKLIFENFLKEINSLSGSKEKLSTHEYALTEKVLKIAQIKKLLPLINEFFTDDTIIVNLLNLFQLAYVCKRNETNLKNIHKYYCFISDKQEINDLLNMLNCTWKSIKATQKNGSFVIEFPKANLISNGERDVLCFVGKLFEAKKHLQKQTCILIIDEIFDYLDDANLIAVQYFLINFIKQFKNSGRELFPILLTHLDPLYFNTYSFPTKNVVYLNKMPNKTNTYKINNLLKDRNNCRKNNVEAYDTISKNYLHYSEDNSDAKDYLVSLGIDEQLLLPISFRESATRELNNYKSNLPYDVALVCCGVRLLIEKNTYSQLSNEEQIEFIKLKKTIDKLSYAKSCGAKVPEIYFLLSIIYNECMHLDEQCKKLRQISCKLDNKVIKNMICNL